MRIAVRGGCEAVVSSADAYVQAVLTALAPWYKGEWEG